MHKVLIHIKLVNGSKHVDEVLVWDERQLQSVIRSYRMNERIKSVLVELK